MTCILQLVDVLYDFISRNRISLGNAMDALLAGKKLQVGQWCSMSGFNGGEGNSPACVARLALRWCAQGLRLG